MKSMERVSLIFSVQTKLVLISEEFKCFSPPYLGSNTLSVLARFLPQRFGKIKYWRGFFKSSKIRIITLNIFFIKIAQQTIANEKKTSHFIFLCLRKNFHKNVFKVLHRKFMPEYNIGGCRIHIKCIYRLTVVE